MKSWEVIHGRIFVLFFPLSALKLTAALRRREKPSPHPAEPCMDELNDFYSSTQPRFTCNTARSSESTTVGIDYQHLGILFVWSRTGSMVEHPPANAGDLGSIPGSGRFPRKGNGNPLHCSCLGNPMDRGAWWATVQGISTESDSTEPEWLNNNTSAYLINLLLQLSRHCCCCCWAASAVSDSVRPHRRQPTRLPRAWDFPGNNTEVGCHFLLQCVKVKSLSHVRLLATPWTAAYQAPPSMGFSRQEYCSGVPLPSPYQSPNLVWCCTVISRRPSWLPSTEPPMLHVRLTPTTALQKIPQLYSCLTAQIWC